MAQVQRTVRVRLVRVIDGDSVQVRPAGLLLWLLGMIMDGHIECRMYGIDAPELGQDLGPRSRDELAKLMRGRAIWMDVMDVDQYGRTVARFYRDRCSPSDSVNYEMVRQGWAYWYKQWARDDDELRFAEEDARLMRRGVWTQPAGGQRPWDWRRKNRQAELTTTRQIRGLWKLVAAAVFLGVMGLDAMLLDSFIARSLGAAFRWLTGMIF